MNESDRSLLIGPLDAAHRVLDCAGAGALSRLAARLAGFSFSRLPRKAGFSPLPLRPATPSFSPSPFPPLRAWIAQHCKPGFAVMVLSRIVRRKVKRFQAAAVYVPIQLASHPSFAARTHML